MLSIPALSLSFSFSVLHDPTFKTAPPSPPSCSRAHLPLMPIVLSSLSLSSYFSLLLLHSLSLLSLCVFVSLSVNLSQLNLLNLALNYSVTFSLQHTFWYTSRMCNSLPS